MAPEFPTEFNILDLTLTPIYLVVVLLIFYKIRSSYIQEFPYFKYLIPGLLVKIFGALSMCFVYIYYYQGGDTLNYFYSSRVMLELAKINPKVFIDILLFGNLSPENMHTFTMETGIPSYSSDPLSFFIIRLATPFPIFSSNSMLSASLLFTVFSYSGIWKLYSVFVEEFPTLEKDLAFAVLFMPSVFFWGSGILKDPVTLSAVGWFTFAFYKIVIQKFWKVKYIIYFLISSYLLLSIKPYIYYVLIPSSAAWLLLNILSGLKTGFIRTITFPIIFIIFGAGAYFLILQIGQDRSKFSIDSLFNNALVTYEDMKNENYGGASFDIGNYDASLGSLLSKSPIAISSALFRPFIWESRNPLMFFSALENTFLLIFTLYLLIKVKFRELIATLMSNPILIFTLSFTILFAFSIGISTSNFGTLVRYKIPFLPFYVASLFILKSSNDLLKIKANKTDQLDPQVDPKKN